MSKTGSPRAPRNRYRKGEVKQQMRDALGSDVLEYELDDGSVVSWPWPFDYSKEQQDALKALDDDADIEEAMRILLDDYDLFEAGGGDPIEWSWINEDAVNMVTDLRAGRKRPIQS